MNGPEAPDARAGAEPTAVQPLRRCGRVAVRAATGEDGVAHIRIAPDPRRVIVTVAVETLVAWAILGGAALAISVLGAPEWHARLPWLSGAAGFAPFLFALDNVIFGQNEAAYVGSSTLALRPPLGFWYLLRRVAVVQPRYEPPRRPWWSMQREMGQQGAGVLIVGPADVGIRFGNALSEEEARFVLDAIGDVPASLTFHEEVGPSPTDVGVRIAIGVAIAVGAFVLMGRGLGTPALAWLVGVGYLLLGWVAYRFWFNLFRRRPEYAK